jgi:hypothetical protein
MFEKRALGPFINLCGVRTGARGGAGGQRSSDGAVHKEKKRALWDRS